MKRILGSDPKAEDQVVPFSGKDNCDEHESERANFICKCRS